MIKVAAYAKFDLAIHIEPKKKADGYYPVHYIDCQLSLADKLSFEPKDRDIEIVCDHPGVPKGRDNFVWKVADLLRSNINKNKLGVRITLTKNIPIKAGFGGGSSDAAATLVGLCKLWKIKLSDNLAKNLAKDLGKDFYYSIYGRVSEVIGDGKDYKVVPIGACLPQFWLVILVPKEDKPSTGWIYEYLKAKNIGHSFGKIAKLKEAILKHNKTGILANLSNDFEKDVSSYFPVIDDMKENLNRLGALSAIMAGAGLSVVGFFDSQKKAQSAKESLEQKYRQVLVTHIN